MGFLVALVAALVWVALVWVLWIRPLMDASRRSRAAYAALGRTRAATICLILLLGWIGGAYYSLRIRPDLAAAEEEDHQPEVARALIYSGGTSSSPLDAKVATSAVIPPNTAPSLDRELFIRNIPPDVQRVDTIPLGSEYPPLGCSRQDVVEAVRRLDPDAETTQHRLIVARPGLELTIVFPMQDPLREVLLHVRGGGDRDEADGFISSLLTELQARAFDTGSPTLLFTPQD
jgi:hypothetical protein